jgi:inosine/xanthosine triphosphatase
MGRNHQITKSPNVPIHILVASTRPAKVDAVRAAVEQVAAVDSRFKSAAIESLEVGAVAPAMPMSDRETLDGARARAAAAARSAVSPFLAIGLEGGLSCEPLETLTSWAAVTDGVRWGYGSGGRIVLPDAIAREVRGGRELGDVIDAAAGTAIRGTRGAWGLLTLDLVGRRDAFVTATLAALAPFYNPSLYRDDVRR